MRIVGGRYRGRALEAPEGKGTRPTSDKVRQALFNILGGRVAGATVLDAFAGTGAVGLEALSRGASLAVFVERDRAALASLRSNLRSLRVGGEAEVLPLGFAEAAGRLSGSGRAFTIVFLDPPYGPGATEEGMRYVASVGLLRAEGILVAEHDRSHPAPERVGDLSLIRSARYGGTVLSFYERR